MKANGIILVNKPKGISSNSVVNIVKRAVSADKAGHLGTLDVAGEGLLPVTINKATKLFDYFLQKDKEYLTTFKFGVTTDTLDLEGKITNTDDKTISLEEVKEAIPHFIGKYSQMPPIYSAKKIKGQKAYDLARKGQAVELKPKEIEIYDITLIKEVEKNTFLLKVHCSSGTYIRSLCRDIAIYLSTYGVMSNIQRTKCGNFNLKDAYTLEEIKSGNYDIVEIDTLFDYEAITLTKEQQFRILNGEHIKINLKDGRYRLYYNNHFLGISIVENEKMRFELRLC